VISENAVLLTASISFPVSGAAVWITWMSLRYRERQRNADRNAARALKAATP
jgi:hypothetical protein